MALSPRACSEIAAELEGHTMAELRCFAKRHGICLGYDASPKRTCAHAIASWINHEGYDEETARIMVSTPSSYEG